MERRAVSVSWTRGLLLSLEHPPSPNELISPTDIAYCLCASDDGAPVTPFVATFTFIVSALLGEGEYRGCVISQLPVYDRAVGQPHCLAAAGGDFSARSLRLRRLKPGGFGVCEYARLGNWLGVHRRGVSAALGLPLSRFGDSPSAPRSPYVARMLAGLGC